MTSVVASSPPAPASRIPTALLLLVGVLASARAIYYVRTFGVNVPIGDDWDLLRTILKWRMDGFDFPSLLLFHNEHRIVATRLLFGTLLPIVHGNLRVAMLFNVLLVVATLALLMSFFRRTGTGVAQPAQPLFAFFAFVAVAALVTGWFQWQNLLWSFQLPWLLLPFLLVLSIWSVTTIRDQRLCVALVATLLIVALACQANGIIVWLAILPAVYLRLYEASAARRAATLLALVVAIVIVGLLYFANMPSYVVRPRVGTIFEAPVRFIDFFLSALGSPFSASLAILGPERWVGASTGALSIVIAIPAVLFAWKDRTSPERRRVLALALGLLVFSSASLLSIALGRFVQFSPDVIESRYSTFALYFHVGVILVLFLNATRERPVGTVTGMLRLGFLAVCIGVVAGSTYGDGIFLQHGANLRVAQARIRASLELSAALPDRPELAGEIHTVPIGDLQQLLGRLEAYELWSPTRWIERPLGSVIRREQVGTVDGVADAGDRVILNGWARLPRDRIADAVLALRQGKADFLVPVAMSVKGGVARPDVQAALGSDVPLHTGWALEIKRSDLVQPMTIAAYSASDDRLYLIPFDSNALPR